MLIDDIISMIDESGPRSYYSFETFVLNLLKFHLEKQSKSFVDTTKSEIVGDCLAPYGFDEYEGSTLIEVKYNFSRVLSKKIFKEFLFKLAAGAWESNIRNLIIIFAKEVPEHIRLATITDIESIGLPVKVDIWGPQRINKIVSQHRSKAKEIADNLFSLRLETAVGKPNLDWKAERESVLELLRESYSKGQFSLFLGAGVSSSAGMPDWTTLLNSLFVTYLTKEFNSDRKIKDNDISQLVSRLNNVDEPSALMAARYLRKGLVKNNNEAKEFTNAVTRNLYNLRDKKYGIDSSLIKSIAKICMPKRTGAKVRSVISYNFDDLLERQLSQNNILFRSFYTESETYDPDELPVYHVHGFLPENRKQYSGLENSVLVFSEEGYHHLYSDSYHWSNLVQLNSLRENNCLMIGLSMTDPNLRRLLDISARNIEKSKHFAFMRRLTLENFCYDNDGKKKNQVVDNVKGAEDFLLRHHALNEELMRELGVKIIWFEDFDEIPLIIESLSKY
ncbi:SIR2 family protein [Vreelandella aquamarina]|uniref:SIR2 family protein n=1 Tax=Vreelandella aquamarina TaxID=77097 RepID=UPI00384F7A6F